MITTKEISVLRHDLVTPINLIVGYCELLAAEASDQSLYLRVDTLQTIRRLGFSLLKIIDESLFISVSAHRPTVRLRDLGFALIIPAEGLIALTAQLIAASKSANDGPDLEADLIKIREACLQILRMAQELSQSSPESLGLG